jgi:hypothetical protein
MPQSASTMSEAAKARARAVRTSQCDGAERRDQQRDAEPADLGLVDLGAGEGGPGGQAAHLGQSPELIVLAKPMAVAPRPAPGMASKRGQQRHEHPRLG